MDDSGLFVGVGGWFCGYVYCDWRMVMVHYRVCFFEYDLPVENSWLDWCTTLEEAEEEKEKAIYAGRSLDSNVDVRIIKVTEEIL